MRKYFYYTVCFLIAALIVEPNRATADTVSSSQPDLSSLGDGVAMKIDSKEPFNSAETAFTPRAETWQYRVISGDNAGATDSETLNQVSSDQQTIWRRVGAPGHETDFVVSSSGVFKTRITDPDHQLVMEYMPGEPEILNGLLPGDTRQSTYSVRAVSSIDPNNVKDSGQITVAFNYLGDYQVELKMGPVRAHAFKKVLTGKVGPTSINTTLYVLYAEGVGEVARIDHTDVHALMLYNRDSRSAYLLEELPTFTETLGAKP